MIIIIIIQKYEYYNYINLIFYNKINIEPPISISKNKHYIWEEKRVFDLTQPNSVGRLVDDIMQISILLFVPLY